MVHTDTLRGALRWNAAEEAKTRISAVKSSLDAVAPETSAAYFGNGGSPSKKQPAPYPPGGGSAATANAAEQRQNLRRGLGELDAVRQFLQEHINTANRQFLNTGTKDEQLHDALQTGLSELEDVRRRLVRTLSLNVTAPGAGAPPQTTSAAAAAAMNHQQTAAASSASQRPPSASRGRQAGGAAAATADADAHPAAADAAAAASMNRGSNDAAARQALQEHARRLFRGGQPPVSQTTRPASATTATLSQRMAAAAAAAAAAASAGESMHGTTDGLRSASSRLNARPASASTVRPNASHPGGATTTTAAPASFSTGPGGLPARRTSSEGPKLRTSMRSRPTSASATRPVLNTNHQFNTTSSTTVPPASAPASAAVPATATATAGGDSAGTSQWDKYQNWAQNVMSRVHSRRVMKHRQALQRERTGVADQDMLDEDDDRPELSSSSGAPANHHSEPTTAPAQQAPPPPAAPQPAPPKPATATAPTTTSQRPLSAAFSGLRRAQAAAAAATTTTSSSAARPASAAVYRAASTTAATGGATGSSTSQQQQRLDATAQTLREQGNVAFQQKRYADAADAYGRAIELEPTSELLYCNRAAAQLMLGKYSSALADAQAAIDLAPNHVKAHWRAGKACLYLGQTDQARSLYGQAQKLADTAADREAIAAEARVADLLDQCRRCIRLREYTDAVKAADEILQIFPPSGPCAMPWLCLRVDASLHVDANEALQTVTRYTQEDPKCAEAWYLRGKAVFYTGHDAASTSTALGYLAKCREIDPKHNRASVLHSSIDAFAALRDQGNAAYANGRWQEAYIAYTKCLAVDPYNTSLKAIILCNRSAVCIQCERWKDGLDDITQSINCNPQNAKAYTRRARIFQQQGNHDAAVKDLQLAVQLYPSPENNERLQQAIDARLRAANPSAAGSSNNTGPRPPQGASSSSSAGPSSSAAGSAGGSFRYFNFAGGTRPSTAGASRPGTASGSGGAARPQSASQGRNGGAGSGPNPYTFPQRPQSAKATTGGAAAEPSHYEVLCVVRTADDKTLTRAYRDAALKWHPDKWMTATDSDKAKAEEMFKRISTAYTLLKDPAKRRQYDLSSF